ncbi:MAG: Fe-S cluster assembly protein HesB [Candidatus Kariarchaeaceae archaeon]|jgi:A/G-specific adenine glycosylase
MVNRREFPWRIIASPYEVLVSEFMLQQTQAKRVIPKFQEFLHKFPSLESLSLASNKEVLEVWSGLGYNRRAIWLRNAAQIIFQLDGFPTDPKDLIGIKGIGKYTAYAIPIFAFNLDYATVDTNIRRILIYEGFADETTKEKELFDIAKALLPRGKSRDYHSALMDYGSLELTSRNTSIKSKNNPQPFRGSFREVRGQIIKLLMRHDNLSIHDISLKLNYPKNQVKNVLQSLLKDHMIYNTAKKFHL